MTPDEEANVQVPLTAFVEGVVDRAVILSFERHIKNCPVLPRIQALEMSGVKWGGRAWRVIAGVITGVVTVMVAAAVAWAVASTK